jgi:O-antigen/teichoic acid export membrane protein
VSDQTVTPSGRVTRLLFENAFSLIGSQLVTSLLGAGYWWLAARRFTPTALGVAGAAVSAMLLLGSFATLGLGTMLMGELPRPRDDRRPLVIAALTTTAVFGVTIGFMAAAIAPLISAQLSPLRASVAGITIFACGVGATSTAMVLDQALIGLFRGRLQLWRNTVFSAVKLAALLPAALLVSRGDGVAIYATWVVGTVVSVVALRALAPRVRGGLARARPAYRTLGRLRRSALTHYLFNVALQAPSLTLPIVVVAVLSAEKNASFYVAWQVAFLLFAVPIALTSVLYSVVAAQPGSLARSIRLTFATASATSGLGTVVLWLAAPQIVGLFGTHYGHSAALTLRILSLAALPMTIKSHYVAVARISGTIPRAIPLVWAGTIGEVLLAALGAVVFGGLGGFSAGWAFALTLESLVMLPPVLAATRDLRAPSEADALIRPAEREPLLEDRP